MKEYKLLVAKFEFANMQKNVFFEMHCLLSDCKPEAY